MFRSGRQKIPRKEHKRVFSLFSLGPNSPRLAFGSPGPPNNFKPKGLARLGELTASGLSFSSPGRAPMPQGGLFPINRHLRGVLKGPRFRSGGN